MAPIKFTILFSMLLFGAYAQYEAGKTVQSMKTNKDQRKADKAMSGGDREFMRRALELSEMAIRENHGHPFGSVVVKDGKIIGEGWNKSIILKDPSAHAEIEAIRDACKKSADGDITGSIIYASAEPCPMCLSLIYLTGITKVCYSIPHSKIKEYNKDLSVEYVFKELIRPQHERSIPEVQLLGSEGDKYIKSYN